MTDYSALIWGLRRLNLKTPDKAADALEAQAKRIAELEAEVHLHRIRILGLIDMLPDGTLCGEVQEAFKNRKALEKGDE